MPQVRLVPQRHRLSRWLSPSVQSRRARRWQRTVYHGLYAYRHGFCEEWSEVWTNKYFLCTYLSDVKQVIQYAKLSDSRDTVEKGILHLHKGFDTVKIVAVDEHKSDELFATVSGFLTPPTLLLGSPDTPFEVIKAQKPVFGKGNVEVSQHFVSSKDGTKVAYFQIGQKDKAGPVRCLIEGYGSYGMSNTPKYLEMTGPGWLEHGYTLVYANIRGGGEYGPGWRNAVAAVNQPKRFEDFAAIASDLIDRGITTPQMLGAEGGSSGGFLMGNMLTRYPQLFSALVLINPVLDIQRLPVYPPGASWVPEFGNVDTEWHEIKSNSVYHTLQGHIRYPAALFVTNTHDDLVHPAHARRCYAKMKENSNDVYLLEQSLGGHIDMSSAVLAERRAFAYRFLQNKLACLSK